MSKNIPPVKCLWGAGWLDSLEEILEHIYERDKNSKDKYTAREADNAYRLLGKIRQYKREESDGSTSVLFFEREASDLIFLLLCECEFNRAMLYKHRESENQLKIGLCETMMSIGKLLGISDVKQDSQFEVIEVVSETIPQEKSEVNHDDAPVEQSGNIDKIDIPAFDDDFSFEFEDEFTCPDSET